MANMKTIIDKINSYKSYDKRVKARVLAQINPTLEISPEKCEEILKRVPIVMKANKEWLKKFDRVRKVAVALEKHDYAPELNRLHIKGGIAIKASGSRTIEQAVEQIVNYNYDLVKNHI